MSSLPRFKVLQHDTVLAFISGILTHSAKSSLRDLVQYPAGHYRVIFDPSYFNLQAGQTEPSKSQWNTLKKKLKRHDPRIFVFKEYGATTHEGEQCYFLDFGFFAE
jgi:hypothetical protein